MTEVQAAMTAQQLNAAAAIRVQRVVPDAIFKVHPKRRKAAARGKLLVGFKQNMAAAGTMVKARRIIVCINIRNGFAKHAAAS